MEEEMKEEVGKLKMEVREMDVKEVGKVRG
jgi:hypothetical protein